MTKIKCPICGKEIKNIVGQRRICECGTEIIMDDTYTDERRLKK